MQRSLWHYRKERGWGKGVTCAEEAATCSGEESERSRPPPLPSSASLAAVLGVGVRREEISGRIAVGARVVCGYISGEE
jgi:hypothetical protein